MAIVKWDPFREINVLQERVNRAFGEALGRPPAETPETWQPPVEVFEDGEAVVLRADLPGVDRESIDLEVDEGVLTLRGQRRGTSRQKASGYYYNELAYGTFTRSFSLPRAVQADAIKATYRDGVLEVLLPKSEQSKARRIEVTTS